MKTFAFKHIYTLVLGFSLISVALGLNSCKEEIDESNYYTFTGEMMSDYFNNRPDRFSLFATMLNRVKSGTGSTSSMMAALSARGNYTCFAPNNEAIQQFADSIYKKGEIKAPTLEAMTDSICEYVVYNSLIDNGTEEAYLSTEFPQEGNTLNNPTMYERYLTFAYSGTEAKPKIFVNGNSLILSKDNEVENGVVHEIDRVIAPSLNNIAGLIGTAANCKVFSALLTATTWADSLTENIDKSYVDPNWTESQIKDHVPTSFKNRSGIGYPSKKKIGYTIFVETDDVWQTYFAKYGLNPDLENTLEVLSAVRKVVKNESELNNGFEGAVDNSEWDSQDNLVNQFVSYHILPFKLSYDRLTIRFNENGKIRSGATTCAQMIEQRGDWTSDVYEYYETIGKGRKMMKMTAGPKTAEDDATNYQRINRQSVYGSLSYIEESAPIPGVKVLAVNKANGQTYANESSFNGFYYPVTDLLIYDGDVRNKVLGERLRWDFSALFPELATSNIRRHYGKVDNYRDFLLPEGYLDNAVLLNSTSTYMLYSPGWTSDGAASAVWADYQGDEMFCSGQGFDVAIKLPPVPVTTTYELRYGCNVNSVRTIAQFYLGEVDEKLTGTPLLNALKQMPAAGLPIDLRVAGNNSNIGIDTDKDNIGVEDQEAENDLLLRSNGYMRAPMGFSGSEGVSVISSSNYQCRYCYRTYRKILATQTFEAGKTYWVRFKSCLADNPDYEFVMDYFELCPSSVFNGNSSAEDRW